MKNHELLDRIGEVNEDYVLEAGNDAARSRFRWKTMAACAACAALILGAWPVYRAVNPPLHGYTVVEGGVLNTLGEAKVPASGVDQPMPEPMPGGAYVGGDTGFNDGEHYSAPGRDAPSQEEAAAQYGNLLKNGGIDETEPAQQWYGGAWIDNDWPDNVGRLTVAIVDGFRTDELEAQILAWCGGTGDVLFCGAKYSLAHLYALQDPAVEAVVSNGGVNSCGIGVDVIHNCLGIDLYSDGAAIPDSVLAKLAKLDPAGDAIRVRLFTGSIATYTDELYGKGPAPDRSADPVFDGARVEPRIEAEPTPTPADDSGAVETAQPAVYDLPQAKYDLIY